MCIYIYIYETCAWTPNNVSSNLVSNLMVLALLASEVPGEGDPFGSTCHHQPQVAPAASGTIAQPCQDYWSRIAHGGLPTNIVWGPRAGFIYIYIYIFIQYVWMKYNGGSS